jgi:multidrug resistance efflux pump
MTPPRAPSKLRQHRLGLAIWLGVMLLASSLVITVLALRSHAGDREAPPPRPTSSTPTHPIAVGHVDVEGGITPLYPVLPGRVLHVDVHEGQHVSAGAPLFRLDDTLAQLQVREAQAAVEAARTQEKNAGTLVAQHRQKVEAQRQAVAAARTDLELARVQADKARRRFQNNTGGSKEDVESAELLVKKAEAAHTAEQARLAALEAVQPDIAVELARKDVAVKQAQLDRALQGVKECTVSAPVAGTALRILVSAGETLGQHPRQPAMYFCPDAPRIVRAEFEQEFADLVEPGKRVTIHDDSTGKGTWTGHIERIGDWYTQRRSVLLEPLQFNDVRTLEAIVVLDPNQKPLRIGQRVRVQLD